MNGCSNLAPPTSETSRGGSIEHNTCKTFITQLHHPSLVKLCNEAFVVVFPIPFLPAMPTQLRERWFVLNHGLT